MRQTESLHVAIHAAKGTKSDGGSWGIREYDIMVGCFLSLRQEKRVQTHGETYTWNQIIRIPHTASACLSRMPLTLTAYMESLIWKTQAHTGRQVDFLWIQLGFHIRGKRKRHALCVTRQNGKSCKRTRVIPYVRIRHAICRAAANGCVCGKLNRSR